MKYLHHLLPLATSKLLNPIKPLVKVIPRMSISDYPFTDVKLPKPDLDWEYMCDPKNYTTIQESIDSRLQS